MKLLLNLLLFVEIARGFLMPDRAHRKISLQSYSAATFKEVDVAVVGGGPVGLTTAIMIKQLNNEELQTICVLDQLNSPPLLNDTSYWGTFPSERNYNLGLSGRGQQVLQNIGVWELIKINSAEIYGSITWSPNSKDRKPKLIQQRRKYSTLCIERDRLTSALLDEINRQHAFNIEHISNMKCLDLLIQENYTLLYMKNTCNNEEYFVKSKLVIGADGANSNMRDKILQLNHKAKLCKFPDTNEFVYRTLPIRFNKIDLAENCPPDKDVTISARTKNDMQLEALPTKEGIHLGAVLFRANNSEIARLQTEQDARQFFIERFPMAASGITSNSLQSFATKNNSYLPKFQYMYPILHYKGNLCMLGDAIRAVKPYFGLGANSGLEDVAVLNTTLRKYGDNFEKAFEEYSKLRAPEVKALVTMSQVADRWFLLRFIFPVIIDRFCHSLLPSVFERPVFNCMQDEKYTIRQALRRKKIDRAMQFAIVWAVFALLLKKNNKFSFVTVAFRWLSARIFKFLTLL